MASQKALHITPVTGDLKPWAEVIATGLNDNLERQLVEKSRQPNIAKYTPNDAAKRFGTLDMFDSWRSKGRTIHWLLGIDQDLAGIIWYGKEDFPIDIKLEEVPTETLAIRLYEGYTGHGLAVPFMQQSLALYVRAKITDSMPIPCFWLQTDTDNQAALATYVKLGYREVYRDEKRVTMILSSAATAQAADSAEPAA